MQEKIELISKKLADEPIELPGSPFWNVLKRFGRDEAISMVVNVAATAIIALLTLNPLTLSLAGPVIEKIGFFPAHFKEAWSVYRTTPKRQRREVSYYFKRAIKNGSVSLLEDILIHDPFYVAIMYFGLKIYSNVPASVLSAISFVVAVLIVSVLEVGFTELRYVLFKIRMKRAGFGVESYYEARFFIDSTAKPENVIRDLSSEFKLENTADIHYQDRYFDNKLPSFSGRVPRIRLRHRVNSDGQGRTQTAQIVYTRASEKSRVRLDQNRYFPIKKEKLYFMLNDQKMPASAKGIENDKAKKIFSRAEDIGKQWDVEFDRLLAYSSELMVSMDTINCKKPFYILEVKAYKNVRLLIETMRYVMQEFPVIQTTQGKYDLTRR